MLGFLSKLTSPNLFLVVTRSITACLM
ncbi:hypothetical protein LINPERHAP2_LOCUS33269 [Linum perenne]